MIVGTNYAPEVSGIGPYTAVLAEALSSEFNTTVVTGVPHYPQWRIDPRYKYKPVAKERLRGVEVLRLRHHVPRRPTLKGRAAMDGSFVAAAVGPISGQMADAIIAVTPSLAGLAAATIGRRRRPLGVVVQDLTGAAAAQTGAAGGRVAATISQAELSMLRRATSVGVVASGFLEPLIAGGVTEGNLVELPNPSRVVRCELTASQARAKLGWRTDRPLAIHTGNMGLKQGLDTVIDAAIEAPDVDFLLVGDGGEREALGQRARQLGLPNLKIANPVNDEDYPAVLAAADVLLISEAPTVEAMSLPSKITSYVTSNRPIVAAVRPDGITGLHLRQRGVAHVKEPDSSSLAEGVRQVLADGPLRSRLRKAQKAMEESLSIDRAAERYVAFARNLLGAGTIYGPTRPLSE